MMSDENSFEAIQSQIDHTVKEFGLEFYNSVKKEEKNPFAKHFWIGFFLGYISKYEDWRLELFRLVDVLPSLGSLSDLEKHIRLYLSKTKCKKPLLWQIVYAGFRFTGTSRILSIIIKQFVKRLAYTFIAGEDFGKASPRLSRIHSKHRKFTLDLLGEAALSEFESMQFQKLYLDILENYPECHLQSEAVANLSVKCTSLLSTLDPLYFEKSVVGILEKLYPILQKAKGRSVFINLDMEQLETKEIVLEVMNRILLDETFRDYPHLGIVIQSYLKDSYRDIEKLIQTTEKRTSPFTIRLVKGAYWEYETIHARQNEWEEPVFQKKFETDQNYEQCLFRLLQLFPKVRTAIASHNLRSLSFGICLAEEFGLQPENFEIQMLYGMADSYKEILVKMGYQVREYVPVGKLLPGMAYLVRRLIENTTNEGFLKNLYIHSIEPVQFLQIPKETLVHA